MSNLLYQLSAFLKTEPKYLEREKGNIFASALSQTYRYLEFTDTIRARVEKASAKFITSLNEFQEMLNKGNNQTGKSGRYLTKKEEAQFRRKNKNSQVFQLEIESFYIFAKIYLDKTAHALETYFGERRNCSFESFSKFASKFKTLESVDKFTVELELQEIALKLKQEIVDFRDKKLRTRRCRVCIMV